MPDEPLPPALEVPLPSLVGLAIEWWRLSATLGQPGSAGAARHALRKIEDFLRRCELEVQVMDGRPFDPGLAVRVVDAVDDETLPAGRSVIAETVSPLVLWRGRVAKEAEVVTRRGTGRGQSE